MTVAHKGYRGLGPLEKRLALISNIDTSAGEDACWPWTGGASDVSGYGVVRVGSQSEGTRAMMNAHRAVYLELVGPYPEGLELDHLCRNRRCVNPAHLEPVDHRENMRRGIKGVLTTHCPQGHEYTEANTIWSGNRRKCRLCFNAIKRRIYWRNKASGSGGGGWD